MSLAPSTVQLPPGAREVIVPAITTVMTDAKTFYVPATPGAPKTGWVDFHGYAALQVRRAVEQAAPNTDGSCALTITVQQAEALSKILARSRWVQADPGRKKLALAVRKAVGAATTTQGDEDAAG